MVIADEMKTENKKNDTSIKSELQIDENAKQCIKEPKLFFTDNFCVIFQ